MTCCTFRQFQGLWLGSIVFRLAARQDDWQQTQTWLAARRKISLEILQSMGLEVDLATVSPFAIDADILPAEIAISINYDRLELILLPSILLQLPKLELREEIFRLGLKSMEIDRETDIVLWSRLLNLAFKQGTAKELNLRRIVEQVLSGIGVEQTALVSQLGQVVEAEEKGLSLNQLAKTLEGANKQQKAIALAYYCFATTPDDFRMTVKRGASLDSKAASSVCALAATLSGAYNGVTGIPRSWRAIAKQEPIYQQEQQIAALLFQAWTGKYSLEPGKSNQEWIEAIALAQTIQPRKTLKIISQKSSFN